MKTIVEAALNGPWGPLRQPLMPITVDQIVTQGLACLDAGASILHVHAYDAETGVQDDDADIYGRIIEGIHARVPDVIVYPTIPLLGSGLSREPASAESRYAHVEALARRGLLEMAVVDPGSVNFTFNGSLDPGFVYLNPEDHVLRGLEVCEVHGLRPSFAIYEPGFTRAGAALSMRCPALKSPLYRFMFSQTFAWGFPRRRYGLDAHLALKNELAPRAPWMVAGLGVDIAPLIADAVELGGHVRVGLEDALLDSDRGNVELVREAVELVEATGARPATHGEARAILAASDGA